MRQPAGAPRRRGGRPTSCPRRTPGPSRAGRAPPPTSATASSIVNRPSVVDGSIPRCWKGRPGTPGQVGDQPVDDRDREPRAAVQHQHRRAVAVDAARASTRRRPAPRTSPLRHGRDAWHDAAMTSAAFGVRSMSADLRRVLVVRPDHDRRLRRRRVAHARRRRAAARARGVRGGARRAGRRGRRGRRPGGDGRRVLRLRPGVRHRRGGDRAADGQARPPGRAGVPRSRGGEGGRPGDRAAHRRGHRRRRRHVLAGRDDPGGRAQLPHQRGRPTTSSPRSSAARA